MEKSAKKTSTRIIVLCWAAYTTAYIGRLNLNANIEPIRDQLGASKTEMGLVLSFFFFSYGAGQLVHGILSRKYNTRWSVAIALFGAAAVNVGMALCPHVAAMRYVWLLGGAFQSILWSSVIKTLSDCLPDEMLSQAVVIMSTTAALGTFLSYGMAALFSALGADYRWAFYVPAALLAVICAVWFFAIGRLRDSAKQNEVYVPAPKQRQAVSPLFVFGAALLAFAAITNGFVKDGVTTWTPSILRESYGLPESLSIIVTVVLPLIAVFGATVSALLRKRVPSTYALNAMFYGADTLILLLVFLIAHAASAAGGTAKNPVLMIVLFGFSAMLMSAVNNVITSIIPLTLRDRMDSGLLAGVLDTFCYVGSTLSSGLLGYIADRDSWNGVFFCLLLFCGAAFVCSMISTYLHKRRPDMVPG